MKKTRFSLGGGRASFAVFAVVFAAVVALALPTTALASADQQPKATGSKHVWYNGKSHHFKCIVQDNDGTVLTEGKDFTRSYAFVSDRSSPGKNDESAWVDTDDDMTSSGFVWERITYIGDYAKWDTLGYHSYVRHNICTQYEFAEQNVTKIEGEADPSLTATLKVLVGDPTTEIGLSAFTLSREDGEKPGEYAITYTTDPEQIPETYKSNAAHTRFGYPNSLIDGYTNIVLVGDDICGFNYIKVVPGTLTIVPATTDVTVTIAWKDSSNKDGIRPSAADFAKLLSLTADGEASDAQPNVVDNGNDTYTVTYRGVRKYAYTADDERYEIDYQVTQASVADYTTDKATVGNGGTITNTHTAKVTPSPEKKDPVKPAADTTERKSNVPKTGDESSNALTFAVLGASVLGVAVVAKKRTEL